jgi:CheY-like chemotaxis protein/signal transduction histidine kinase
MTDAGTILVVEDNAITRLLVTTALRSHGFAVVEAADGATALRLFAEHQPDVALIDILLPDIDGWDVAAQFQARRGAEHVPLLALTGCLSKVDEARMARSAFTDVVTKPVDPTQLVSIVRAYRPSELTGVATRALAGLRIVVADDDPIQQKLLGFHLRRLGCRVEDAPNGLEALAHARRERPDAIISDVMMPKLDGFGLCMEARQDPSLASVPIVLTTNTFVDEGDRALGLRAGADAFVMRTPQMHELIAAVEQVLSAPAAARVPQGPAHEVSLEHTGRILQQLDRQVTRNARLSQHCATLSAELSVLRGFSEALVRSADAESALRMSLETCFDAGGIATGALLVRGADGSFRAWPAPDAGAGLAHPFAGQTDRPLLDRSLATGSSVAFSTATASEAPQREFLERHGFASALIAPVMQGDAVLGLLVMASKTSGLVERDRVLFAEAIANQLALSLTMIRAFETLEARVRERTADAEAAREDAERANRAKTSFLSAVSHDLRTPLNAILGFAQLMELDGLGEHAEHVRQILTGGRHLLDLINEVLDISRIESGQLVMTLDPVPVADAVGEVIDLIGPLAAKRALTVTTDLGAGGVVRADRQRLRQVLLNLVSNAVKYNREGGSITVTCETRADTCRIAVTDTGPGIPEDKRALLFRPFQRLGAEHSAIEGTGLGLALARALVEQMRGAIGADSVVGQGSTFWAELPLAAADSAPARPREATRLPVRQGPASRGTLLYIEDNAANVRLMERVLARRPGVTMIQAARGGEAFDLVRQHRPELVLLDVQLPDMSGAEVLRQLRMQPEWRDVPVVILTADATPGLASQFTALGATAFLTKPLDVAQILGMIDQSLAQQT